MSQKGLHADTCLCMCRSVSTSEGAIFLLSRWRRRIQVKPMPRRHRRVVISDAMIRHHVMMETWDTLKALCQPCPSTTRVFET